MLRRYLKLTPRKFTWLVAEALVPVLLLIVVYYPIGEWASPGQSHPRERYLGSGDLIAVSVALIVPVVLHLGSKIVKQEAADWPAHVMAALLGIMLIIGMIFYGAVKIKHVAYAFPDQGPIAPVITEMTNFCVWYTIATIGALYAAKTDLE